jgi:mannose-1-phosphate guanylyltransferase/mannose-6-phosphate isomerase
VLIPVILSGGSGTRLWPLSRELYPKQLMPLVAERSMLQETVARTDGLSGIAPPIVVCNENHRFMVAEQLRELDVTPQAIVLEPLGRNTAPAAAIAALLASGRGADSDPVLLVLPADHVISDVPAFHAAVAVGRAAAEAGSLVTFGVVVDRVETGYGYIQGSRKRPRVRSRSSWKSPMPPRRGASWSPASTTGTAACSCSARARFSPNSTGMRP